METTENNPTMQRLTNRTVIVTGGGSGIGKGASQRIAEEGGNVVIADKRLELAELELAEVVAAGVRKGDGNAIAVHCDVTVEEKIEATVKQAVAEFGGLWGMVANAGTSGSGWIHETDRRDWQFFST